MTQIFPRTCRVPVRAATLVRRMARTYGVVNACTEVFLVTDTHFAFSSYHEGMVLCRVPWPPSHSLRSNVQFRETNSPVSSSYYFFYIDSQRTNDVFSRSMSSCPPCSSVRSSFFFAFIFIFLFLYSFLCPFSFFYSRCDESTHFLTAPAWKEGNNSSETSTLTFSKIIYNHFQENIWTGFEQTEDAITCNHRSLNGTILLRTPSCYHFHPCFLSVPTRSSTSFRSHMEITYTVNSRRARGSTRDLRRWAR